MEDLIQTYTIERGEKVAENKKTSKVKKMKKEVKTEKERKEELEKYYEDYYKELNEFAKQNSYKDMYDMRDKLLDRIN